MTLFVRMAPYRTAWPAGRCRWEGHALARKPHPPALPFSDQGV